MTTLPPLEHDWSITNIVDRSHVLKRLKVLEDRSAVLHVAGKHINVPETAAFLGINVQL